MTNALALQHNRKRGKNTWYVQNTR